MFLGQGKSSQFLALVGAGRLEPPQEATPRIRTIRTELSGLSQHSWARLGKHDWASTAGQARLTSQRPRTGLQMVRSYRASASIPPAVIDDPAIEALRQRIDAIDHRLLALLAERLDVVHQVGEEKRQKNLAVFDPKREEILLQKLIRDAPAAFDEEAVRAIFTAIVSQCRRLEDLALSQQLG